MKTESLLVIALGLMAAAIRAVGAPHVADVAAIGYLLAATLILGRLRRVNDHLVDAAVSVRAPTSRRFSQR